MSQLEPLIQQLQQMPSAAALPDFFRQVQQAFGYRFVGLVLWQADDRKTMISTQQQDAFEVLVNEGNIQQFCQQRLTPVFNSDLMATSDESALLIPVRGLGIESGAIVIGLQAAQLELAQQIAWYWSIVAGYLYEAIYRFRRADAGEEGFRLTSREQACLSWAAKGKTSWEISLILNIKERTVNFHLANCIQKTKSSNRQQAISKCISAGCLHS